MNKNSLIFKILLASLLMTAALPVLAGKKGKKRAYSSDSEIESTYIGTSSTRGITTRPSATQIEEAKRKKRQKRYSLIQAHLNNEDKESNPIQRRAKNFIQARTSLSNLADAILSEDSKDQLSALLTVMEEEAQNKSTPDTLQKFVTISPQLPEPVKAQELGSDDECLQEFMTLSLNTSSSHVWPEPRSSEGLNQILPEDFELEKENISRKNSPLLPLVSAPEEKATSPQAPLSPDQIEAGVAPALIMADLESHKIKVDSPIDKEIEKALPAATGKSNIPETLNESLSPTDESKSNSPTFIEGVINFAEVERLNEINNNVIPATPLAPAAVIAGRAIKGERNKRLKRPKNNLMQVAPIRKKNFKCTSAGCEYVAEYKSRLEEHMVTHTGEKKYKCEKCLALFSRPNDVNRHIKNNSCKKTNNNT